ncbi:MAG: rod shape-determining protein MreD [Ardenticatenaceae bacterium]
MSPWLLLLLLAAMLQSTLLPGWTFFGVHPNLVLVLVVAWSLLRGGREGLIWGLVGGILLDLYSITPFGTFTVAMLVIALVAGFAELTPFRPALLLPVGMVLALSPLFHLVALGMMQSLGWDVAWSSTWRLLPASAILNALLTLLLFRPMRALSRRAGERAIEWS